MKSLRALACAALAVIALASSPSLAATEQSGPVAIGNTPSLDLVITVIQPLQTMLVRDIPGHRSYTWVVSTGKKNHQTPDGTYHPTVLAEHYVSKTYGERMWYSVFYDWPYAIHATDHEKDLGEPASHGCVRLSYQNARTLFNLVKKYGKEHVAIVVTGQAQYPQRLH